MKLSPKKSAFRVGNDAVAVLSGSVGADLSRVILAWPNLGDAARKAVLTLCEGVAE